MGTAIRKTPDSSSCVVSEEEKKNSSSDEARGRTLTPPNYAVDDPAPQQSCPTVDELLAKAQFLSPLLYQIHCIGPVGFGFAHIYSERHPPKTETLQLASSVGRTCVLVRTIIEQGGAKPLRGNDDGQPTGPQMENCQEVPSSTGVGRYVHGPRPQQGPDDPRTSRAAPVGPRWRKTAAARNAFKGLLGGNSFWRSMLMPSNSLEQSNGAVAWVNPQEA